MTPELTRRELIGRGATGAAALRLYGLLSDSVARALTASAQCGQLTDIEYVVILIQENRSFRPLLRHLSGRPRLRRQRLPLNDGPG